MLACPKQSAQLYFTSNTGQLPCAVPGSPPPPPPPPPIRGRTATEPKLRTCCIRRWQSRVVGGHPGLDPNTNFEETQGSV